MGQGLANDARVCHAGAGRRSSPQGPSASRTVIVLIASGAQLILTGMLREYVWRTLDETRRRPPYLIDTTFSPQGEGTHA